MVAESGDFSMYQFYEQSFRAGLVVRISHVPRALPPADFNRIMATLLGPGLCAVMWPKPPKHQRRHHTGFCDAIFATDAILMEAMAKIRWIFMGARWLHPASPVGMFPVLTASGEGWGSPGTQTVWIRRGGPDNWTPPDAYSLYLGRCGGGTYAIFVKRVGPSAVMSIPGVISPTTTTDRRLLRLTCRYYQFSEDGVRVGMDFTYGGSLKRFRVAAAWRGTGPDPGPNTDPSSPSFILWGEDGVQDVLEIRTSPDTTTAPMSRLEIARGTDLLKFLGGIEIAEPTEAAPPVHHASAQRRCSFP
ncbi:hypothetical protein SAMD00023353_10600190 [Rosellinia necatrix]|uniref:Uncharacterized protein n=1 Tax=Rosellinia necatrix TaxID=77044 RepID=A0A1S7UR19_ROSNE|nr:hypothetical protein SAMD00023353_10600190 [Rosellinia necatrix]